MAAAVEALGPDLVVRRARKVRSGVRGLMGKDRYEVLAAPGARAALTTTTTTATPSAAPSRRCMNRAEEQDSAPAAEPRRPLRGATSRGARLLPPRRPARRTPAAEPVPRVRGRCPRRRARRPRHRARRPRRRAGCSPASPSPPRACPSRPRAPRSPAPAGSPTPPPAARSRPAYPTEPLVAGPPPEDEAWTPPPSARTLSPVPDEPPVRSRRSARDVAAPRRNRRSTDAPHPQPDVARHEERAVPIAQERRAPEPAAVPAPPAPSRARRSAAPAVGTWSKAALTRLGVPAAVLDDLDPPAPGDDLGWVVALTSAIAAAVPDPGEPDEKHPVVVSGHGLAGVVAMLDAGSRGAAPRHDHARRPYRPRDRHRAGPGRPRPRRGRRLTPCACGRPSSRCSASSPSASWGCGCSTGG